MEDMLLHCCCCCSSSLACCLRGVCVRVSLPGCFVVVERMGKERKGKRMKTCRFPKLFYARNSIT